MVDLGTITVVDPTAEDDVERHSLAPRLASLAGTTIGLIDNSKRMADAFLDELGDLLRERHGVARIERFRKISPSVAAPPEVLARLATVCDGVVHAVAD